MATATGTPTETTTPPDAPLRWDGSHLREVDYATYCQLRDVEANDKLRMTYLDGELWIMSPRLRHDGNSRHLLVIAKAVADAHEVDYMMTGGTTLRRAGESPQEGAGKEPDEGLYLGADEAHVRDNEDLDLAVDPPPTLAIEIDNTGDSVPALATYARLGVPEVWIHKARRRELRFYRLGAGTYAEVNRSVALPWLTPGLVLDALTARRTAGGDRRWSAWLDDWARALPEPPAPGS